MTEPIKNKSISQPQEPNPPPVSKKPTTLEGLWNSVITSLPVQNSKEIAKAGIQLFSELSLGGRAKDLTLQLKETSVYQYASGKIKEINQKVKIRAGNFKAITNAQFSILSKSIKEKFSDFKKNHFRQTTNKTQEAYYEYNGRKVPVGTPPPNSAYKVEPLEVPEIGFVNKLDPKKASLSELSSFIKKTTDNDLKIIISKNGELEATERKKDKKGTRGKSSESGQALLSILRLIQEKQNKKNIEEVDNLIENMTKLTLFISIFKNADPKLNLEFELNQIIQAQKILKR